MDDTVRDFDGSAPDAVVWDVVIVGTGAGGATVGLRLAQSGLSVLFLERGRLADASSRTGDAAFDASHDCADALQQGRWPEPIESHVQGAAPIETPPLGCGAGGSSALYSMAMERFRPEDFAPRQWFKAQTQASLPEQWPISYETLKPFYAAAERLFRVRGSCDPLGAGDEILLEPAAMQAEEGALHQALREKGLHPYRMHSACERVPGCSGCKVTLCPRECRNDAGRICLQAALRYPAVHVLFECQALRLNARGWQVTGVRCNWRGREIDIAGRTIVLAANAFASPALLLRSSSEHFPNGLANNSGCVGRNLMLHVSDWFELRCRGAALEALGHGLSIGDFYVHQGTKLGTLHVHATGDETDATAARSSPPLFSSVLEDLPYPENRVTVGPGASIRYHYRYPEELRHRSVRLLREFKAAVAPDMQLRPLAPLGRLNVTHVCGTCRAGHDPASSVVDANNRAHEVDNLYVVDASFFPSSGGTTPCLTIVANALRVAGKITASL